MVVEVRVHAGLQVLIYRQLYVQLASAFASVIVVSADVQSYPSCLAPLASIGTVQCVVFLEMPG